MFGRYIVYADESGDHGLTKINPENPVFVLAFCIFEKTVYVEQIVPALQRMKFEFWGHDSVILHSHEIRKALGHFNILQNAQTRERWMARLDEILRDAPFTIVAAAIRKQQLTAQYVAPDNPYELALTFCMERLHAFLHDSGEDQNVTHVLVERRGKREDKDLELVFRRICDGHNRWGPLPNLRLVFADKKHNSSGLQIADLVAHPIARHTLNPGQANRPYEVLQPKFRRSPGGRVPGWGLKAFP